jgi:hypothetical protein
VPEFNVTRKHRDASPAIRGFVYQIENTIDRWLRLAPGEEIELESGEDIDTIANQWNTHNSGYERLLEQIKVRQAAISLQSQESRESIANFAEHRSTNKDIRLRFRFVTNANPTHEKRAKLPKKQSGISLWEAIRTDSVRSAEVPGFAGALRALLAKSFCPKNFNPVTWKHFELLVRRPMPEFVAFVKDFEWSTGNPPHPDMRGIIYQELRGYPDRPDDTTVERRFLQMFVHIALLLSEKGPKRLTIQDRDDLMRRSTTGSENSDARVALCRSLLAEHSSRLDQHEQRIATLEGTAAQQETERQNVLGLVQEMVASIARAADSEEGITRVSLARQTGVLDASAAAHTANLGDFGAQIGGLSVVACGHLGSEGPPDFNPPPALLSAIERPEFELQVTNRMRDAIWTALWGGSGTGKTELARRLLVSCEGRQYWLRFRNLDPIQTSRKIRVYLAALGGPERGDKESLYDAAAHAIGDRGLLVVDDLPAFDTDDEPFRDLYLLVRAFEAVGARMLSTSLHPPSDSVVERMRTEQLTSIQNPPFSLADIERWLVKMSAPAEWMGKAARNWLLQRTHGHPTLLARELERLARARWPSLSETVESCRGEEIGVDQGTMRRLVRSVGDVNTRGLLNRLTQVIGQISIDEARAAAFVEPQIPDVQARLGDLTGIWLQVDSPGRFVVSPLISRLGDTELLTAERLAVNEVLADQITQKASLTIVDVLRALEYFRHAGNGQRAAALLCWSLHATYSAGDQQAARLLLSRSAATTSGVLLGPKMLLFAAKIMTCDWLGEPTQGAGEQLLELLNSGTEQETSVVTAAAITAAYARKTLGLQVRCRLLRVGLRNVDSAKLPDGTSFTSSLKQPLEDLLWLQAGEIRSTDDAMEWLATLRSLSPDSLVRAKASSLYEVAATSVADRLWLRESDKDAGARDWKSIEATLNAISDAAVDLDMDIMWTWAVRTRVIVAAECMKESARGIQLAKESLSSVKATPVVRFGLWDIISVEEGAIGRRDEAVAALEEALRDPLDGFEFWRSRAMIRLASLEGENDRKRAVSILEGAVALLSASHELPETEMVKAMSELAIAQWLESGDVALAFATWEEAARRLFGVESKQRTDSWKALFVRFGHVSGYFSSVASSGSPPKQTASGEPYAAPQRGMFLGDNVGLIEFYGRVKDHNLLAQLAMYADGIGRDDSAKSWALKAVRDATAAGDVGAVSLSTIIAAPRLITSDQYDEAVRIAVVGGKASAEGMNRLRASADKPDWLVQREEPSTEADEYSLLLAALPAALRIARGVSARNDVQVATRSMSGACEAAAGQSNNPDLWTSLAVLFADMFIDKRPLAYLHAEANRLGERWGDTVRAIAYVGASVAADAPLKHSLILHDQVFRFARRMLQRRSSVYRLLLDPFVVEFWERALVEQAFQFYAPRVVKAEFAHVCRGTMEEQVPAVLKVVANGLVVSLKSY